MITNIKTLHVFLLGLSGLCFFQINHSFISFVNTDDLLKSTFQNLTKNSVPKNRWYVLGNSSHPFFQSTVLSHHPFQNKKIAVLVTGLFSNPSTLTTLGQFLKKKDKYDHVFCFCYGLGEPNLLINTTGEISKGLADIIVHKEKIREPSQVDIFAHSFGGLLTRYVLEKVVPGSMSIEQASTILSKCKHVFFFGTPHKEINPLFFKNTIESVYNKAVQNSFMAMYLQSYKISSETLLAHIKKLEEYECLTNKTKLLNHLKPISQQNNYYNIIGLKNEIEFHPVHLSSFNFPINGFFHDAYKKIDPAAITDGVVSKDNASLISLGLSSSHELEVNYNHNALVGISNEKTIHEIPKPIRQWIKSILKGSLKPQAILNK